MGRENDIAPSPLNDQLRMEEALKRGWRISVFMKDQPPNGKAYVASGVRGLIIIRSPYCTNYHQAMKWVVAKAIDSPSSVAD